MTDDKYVFIKDLLNDETPDVFCVNEYGVDPETPVHFHFEGFTLFDYDLKGPFAGTAIYVRKCLQKFTRSVHIKNDMKRAQFSAIEINGCRLVSIYRSPSQTPPEVDRFCEILDSCISKNGPTVIVSDMNLPHVDWQEFDSKVKSQRTIATKLSELGLLQLQFQPSFKKSNNVLDVVLTNDFERVESVRTNTIWNHDTVDHYPVIVRLSVETQVENWIEVTLKKKIDYKVFLKAIEENMETLLKENPSFNVEKINHQIKSTVLLAAELATPKVKIDQKKTGTSPSFTMSKRTEELFKKKNELLAKGDIKAAKSKQAMMRKSLRMDKKRWSEALVHRLDRDTNEVWKLLQSATSTGVCKGGLRLSEETEELEFRPEHKVEILNQRYASVLTPKTLPTCDPDDPHGCEVPFGITDVKFTVDDVLEALSEANNSYATDSVGLNMAMFRKAKELLAPVLASLFNRSMEQTKLAKEWLLALINPIPKTGDPTLAKSYRPVALEHTILRIMESIINKKLVQYLDSIDFFHPKQYGFRKRHSCVHNMLDYWSFVTHLMETKGMVDVVYGDTSAAFDRLSHGLVLDKLFHQAGVAGKLWKWLNAWTMEREQYVKLDGHFSTKTPVTSSCLQGSCLGTTMWNVYINDICHYMETLIADFDIPENEICFFLYADDLKLAFFPSEDNVRKVNRLLEKLCIEMDRLYLVFNANKCSVLSMGKTNPKRELKMRNPDGSFTVLNRVEVERDLGVQVSADGLFRDMKYKSYKRSLTVSRFLAKVLKFSTWNAKVQTYYAHIFSKGSYASELWRPTTRYELDEFNKVWINYFKFVKPPKNGIPPLLPEQLMIKKDLLMLYDVYHERAPVDAWKIFPEQQQQYGTRSKFSGVLKRDKHTHWNKNLLYQRNHEFWISIPIAIRDSKNRDLFSSFVLENVIEKLPCNQLREDMISGELRRRSKKQEEEIMRARERGDLAESLGFPRKTKLDPLVDDRDFRDDFMVSDVCQKKWPKKSRMSSILLNEYAPYMLLCHCRSTSCQKEIEEFERNNGLIRNQPKAYVKEGVVRTKFGEIKIPWLKRVKRD